MMPNETQLAVDWALQQEFETEGIVLPVSVEMPFFVVDKVREYFNANNIKYRSFSYDDLIPYLPN